MYSRRKEAAGGSSKPVMTVLSRPSEELRLGMAGSAGFQPARAAKMATLPAGWFADFQSGSWAAGSRQRGRTSCYAWSRLFSRGAPIDEDRLRQLLSDVRGDKLTLDDAVAKLRDLPYEDLGFARIDHHRALREGFPEVVLGSGKTPEQIATIASHLVSRNDRVLVTRSSPEAFQATQSLISDAVYDQIARTITVNRHPSCPEPGVTILSAGTADLPVAEEAAITAEMIGSGVERIYDVGVAGIHRLLDCLPQLRAARVIVVVAGMEGALPSVVAGLVGVPVIGVPTSIGYGASFQGLAPLLTMLNSCAAGVCVVNIDNGFGAGYLAAIINRAGRPAEVT